VVVLGGGVFGRFVLGPHFLQLLGCVEGVVGVTLINQLFGILGVKAFCLALALAIGAIGAGVEGTFVWGERAPGKAVEDIFFGSGYIAALVGVFDAEDEVALVLAGVEVIIEYGSDASEV